MPINYEAAKTLIKGLVQKMKSFRGNWEQNDPTADDYIKNRTHWKEIKTRVLIPETSIEFANAGHPVGAPFILEMQEGSTYEVTWNGNVYQCVAYIAEGPNTPSIGNGTIASLTGGNDEPFFITVIRGDTLVFAEEAGTHTVSISSEATTWHTLDKRYLPTNLATTDDVQSVANKVQTVANNVNKKMNATNPVGTGSFSMNRKAGTAVGQNSHTEGCNTTASGFSSHAEGNDTVASGKAQHVEGVANIEDTEDKYIHIAGNGVDSSNRSNAHTLDWSGNAWFQGDVYVSSTSGINKDEGSKKLVTEDYVSEAIETLRESLDNLASKTYVDTSVASLVNSAPETLDTLGELATAMEENESVVNALNQAIANKADSSTVTQLQEAVNAKAENSALNEHTTNSTIHITAAERAAWNSKMDGDSELISIADIDAICGSVTPIAEVLF